MHTHRFGERLRQAKHGEADQQMGESNRPMSRPDEKRRLRHAEPEHDSRDEQRKEREGAARQNEQGDDRDDPDNEHEQRSGCRVKTDRPRRHPDPDRQADEDLRGAKRPRQHE